MARDLLDKVIVITGASSGIGAATAVACAEAGMNVVLNARRADQLEAVAERVRKTGREAATILGDVTEPGISKRMLDLAAERFGGFDVVFANAGYGMVRTGIDQTDEDLRRMFDVNFFAATKLLRAAARRLKEQKQTGHLLMCSSCVSKFALPKQGAYAATKAAQDAVCQAMRLELRDEGIDVSSVHPITTKTEFHDTSARKSGLPASDGKTPKHAPPMFTQTPERVATAIVKCLRNPVPEVWTSTIVRTMAAVMTFSPRFGDWILARQAAKDE